jgi:rubrerythrin
MRVRPNRNASEPRRSSGVLRRPHAPSREEPAPPPTPPATEDEFADERRARESGGPEDRAMYTCSCGYVFEAEVSTSVACPHCGAGQAW